MGRIKDDLDSMLCYHEIKDTVLSLNSTQLERIIANAQTELRERDYNEQK